MLKSPDKTRRTISSSFTFFYKFFFPTIWIGGFGSGTLDLLLNQDKEGIPFLIAWIAGSLFIYWGCVRLKYVEVDENKIYISNFFKMIEIPLQGIERISENSLINIHPIWISLKNPTDFGQKIMFMPKFSFRASFFYSHPIAKELYELARDADRMSATEHRESDGSEIAGT